MVMHLRIPAPEWDGGGNPDKEASCRKFKPTREHDDFFGDGTGSQTQAKHICNGTYTGRVCPLREQCLQFALVNNEHYGTWSGLYPIERAYIRKFVPRAEWSYDKAPTQEQLLAVWPDRVTPDLLASWEEEEYSNDSEDETGQADEADGEDGLVGGNEEEPIVVAG